ncbi:TetR/AcrR family transcriptional regulator [Chitinophagaceae bacterium MMS25-I14]
MNRKEAVLKSVLKLVNREGFYHLNMKSIAQEANVAAGTIYVHFKGKAELINALYLMIVNDFKETVLSGYKEGRSFRENFFEMFHNAVDFYVNDPDCFSFIEQYTYAPFIFKETQEENFVMMEPVYKIIGEAKKQKLVKNLPPELLVSMIWGPVTMMMKLHLAHKVDLGNKQTKQKLLQACWDSISAE